MSEANRPTRVGRVLSNKMQKTVVVGVEEVKRHPLYRRAIRRTVRFKAHDERQECLIGDTVRIVESRPISKEKHWRVSEILQRGDVTPEAG